MAAPFSSRVRSVALLLAGSALLSRVLGYGRDFLLNYLYGATEITDVYRASFAVPDMLNYLLAGGALTISFLPRMAAMYAEVDRGPRDPGAKPALTAADVDAVFSRVASFMLCAVVAGVLIAEVFTEPFVALIVNGFDPDQIAATARLTRIVLPAQIFFIFGGLVQAGLLARQRFGALALTPLLYNGGIILGGLAGASFEAIEGFSWGALVGAFFGALVLPLVVARDQLRFRPRLPIPDAEVRRFLWIATPLMIGVSLSTVDEWCGMHFGSTLEEGAISWLVSARRLMLVPIGLVGTAAGQATGAFVARLHAQGRRDELAALLGRSMGAVLALALVISAFAMAEAEPLVGLLFEHGHFERRDTVRTAAALVPLSAGIASWACQAVLARALYSVGDTWRPMLLTTLITGASLPLYAWLAGWGIEGLALAGTLGMTAQVLALLVLARARLGLQLQPAWAGLLRALPVAALAGWGAHRADAFASAAVPGMMESATIGYAIRLSAAGLAWLGVVVVLGNALALPGWPELVTRLRRRLPGAARGPGPK